MSQVAEGAEGRIPEPQYTMGLDVKKLVGRNFVVLKQVRKDKRVYPYRYIFTTISEEIPTVMCGVEYTKIDVLIDKDVEELKKQYRCIRKEWITPLDARVIAGCDEDDVITVINYDILQYIPSCGDGNLRIPESLKQFVRDIEFIRLIIEELRELDSQLRDVAAKHSSTNDTDLILTFRKIRELTGLNNYNIYVISNGLDGLEGSNIDKLDALLHYTLVVLGGILYRGYYWNLKEIKRALKELRDLDKEGKHKDLYNIIRRGVRAYRELYRIREEIVQAFVALGDYLYAVKKDSEQIS